MLTKFHVTVVDATTREEHRSLVVSHRGSVGAFTAVQPKLLSNKMPEQTSATQPSRRGTRPSKLRRPAQQHLSEPQPKDKLPELASSTGFRAWVSGRTSTCARAESGRRPRPASDLNVVCQKRSWTSANH